MKTKQYREMLHQGLAGAPGIKEILVDCDQLRSLLTDVTAAETLREQLGGELAQLDSMNTHLTPYHKRQLERLRDILYGHEPTPWAGWRSFEWFYAERMNKIRSMLVGGFGGG